MTALRLLARFLAAHGWWIGSLVVCGIALLIGIAGHAILGVAVVLGHVIASFSLWLCGLRDGA